MVGLNPLCFAFSKQGASRITKSRHGETHHNSAALSQHRGFDAITRMAVDLPASTIAALYEVVASLPKLRRYWGIFGDRPSARQRIPAPTRHLGMTHIAAPAGYIDIDVILQFKYLTHFVIYFSEGWLIRVNLTKWIARGDMDLWEFSERVTIAQQRGYVNRSGAIQLCCAFDIKDELTSEGQVW
ncbi:hypothetical protein BJ165DRAFT_984823 [Panaeolus papilionaceus]|nr:hypothetical protein BJ165DRAFT_984823 [Panaeolus papilionaceus]